MERFSLFRNKLEKVGSSEISINAFKRNYATLCANQSSEISEETLSPITSIESYKDLNKYSESRASDLLSKTVVIKLNGGLGTSMGLQKAKSLLKIREGKTFLNIIIEQILDLRKTSSSKVKLLFMNSFSTSEDTLSALVDYFDEEYAEIKKLELLQNQAPKIDTESLEPVEYPENPSLEWCPPGHGDLYVALYASGVLDELLDSGVKYAFVSNADNLGATLDQNILQHLVDKELPFLMEVTRRTLADKKGGHIALRTSDQQILLREIAQTSEEDIAEFQNIEKHQFFNTNNLWINLEALKALIEENQGVLPLPVIKNKKNIDPRNPSSKAVYQLEVAMGAAIELFQGASAVCVPRSRFAPVKATSDLFALSSDAYYLSDNSRILLKEERKGSIPIVTLSDEYKFVDSLASLGIPSLLHAEKLSIKGPVRFPEGVVIKGSVEIENSSAETKWVPAGVYIDEKVEL